MKFFYYMIGAYVLVHFLYSPVPIEPQAWDAPDNPGFEGVFEENDLLANYESLAIGTEHGPEDIAIDKEGRIYAGTHSGWIVRMNPDGSGFEKWINTGGRPLGLEFNWRGNLIVADAIKGLLSIDSRGRIKVLVNEFEGEPLVYIDDLDVSEGGDIYFSDASSRFGAEEIGDTLQASMYDIMEHSKTGRIFKFTWVTGKTTLLMDNLSFANGVAVSADDNFLLVNETGAYRVWKYWLKGEKQGTSEILVDNLPGFPDNISRGLDGKFWLGLVAPRSGILDALSGSPGMRVFVQRLPGFLRPSPQSYGHAVAIDGDGNILSSMQDPDGAYPQVTGVTEDAQYLYLTSLGAHEIARIRKPVAKEVELVQE